MRTFVRLLVLLRPFIGWVALSVLLGTATVGSGVGLLGTSAYLIAHAALQPSIASLQVAIVGVRFFGLSRGVFRYLERLVSHSVNFRLLAELRVWFYKALEPLAPARLLDYHSGDLLARTVGDIDILENFYVRVVAPPLVALWVMLGVGAFVGRFDIRLGIILVIGLVLGGLGTPLLAYWIGRQPARRYVIARGRMSASIVDGVQGIGDLIAYGVQDQWRKDFHKLSLNLAAAQRRTAWASGVTAMLNLLVPQMTLVAVLVVAVPLVDEGVLEGALLAVISLIVLASFEGVQPLAQAAQHLEGSLHAAQRLFSLVDTEPSVLDHPDASIVKSPLDLRIHNLSFRYAPDLPLALDNIQMDLPAGKKMALVGPSGAGKTTLIHILLRFWGQQTGEVTLGGTDLRKIKLAETRRQFGLLQPSAYLFTGTLRQNLILAKVDASDVQLHKVLEQVQLGEWFGRLPQGLDTWLGEHGCQMSGGEHQRLAMARLILQDAPIFILDEPTANLDSVTARLLMQILLDICKGRSLLWVTHNLMGLEAVDEILVLQSGRVVESGEHAYLLEQKGLYARMWQIQNHQLYQSGNF